MICPERANTEHQTRPCLAVNQKPATIQGLHVWPTRPCPHFPGVPGGHGARSPHAHLPRATWTLPCRGLTAHMHTGTFMHTHTCTAHIHTCTQRDTPAPSCTCTYAHMHSTLTHTHAQTYTGTLTHMHTGTLTHTQAPSHACTHTQYILTHAHTHRYTGTHTHRIMVTCTPEGRNQSKGMSLRDNCWQWVPSQ